VLHDVPDHRVNALGRIIYAFLITPRGPTGEPPVDAPAEEPTVERGAYLVNNVAGCAGCHSQRSEMDGSYTGPRLAGGYWMPMEDDPTRAYVTPNLTPDSTTGVLHGWTEDRFIARFRSGRVFASSHMPWGSFSKMSDTDLRAVFRYLASLDPVHNETGPQVQLLANRP
jgi:mono/diheme cytochrome c family protein